MQIVGWWFGRQGQGNWAEAGNISFSDVDVDSGQAGCVFHATQSKVRGWFSYLAWWIGGSFQYEKCKGLKLNPRAHKIQSLDLRMRFLNISGWFCSLWKTLFCTKHRTRFRGWNSGGSHAEPLSRLAGGRQCQLVPVGGCAGLVMKPGIFFAMKHGHSKGHDDTTGYSDFFRAMKYLLLKLHCFFFHPLFFFCFFFQGCWFLGLAEVWWT